MHVMMMPSYIKRNWLLLLIVLNFLLLNIKVWILVFEPTGGIKPLEEFSETKNLPEGMGGWTSSVRLACLRRIIVNEVRLSHIILFKPSSMKVGKVFFI